MPEIYAVEENFSIEFHGPAFERHEISVSALAQSLLALDGLARRSAEAAYGKDAEIDIKVKGGFQPGSFIVDLLIQHGERTIVAVAGAVTILTGIIQVGKWAFGKKVKAQQPEENGCVRVENEVGDTHVFNQCIINVYNNTRTLSQLSRLTQTLDLEGAESMRISSANADSPMEEIVTKADRRFFRHEDGLVLTDNESETILEVIGPMLNGSPKGWRFSEGENGVEFIANVEDESFLAAVRDREHALVNGTTIRAVIRTVQRKTVRTITDRTIVEVREVIQPDGTPDAM